jgi:hypothetical protein
MCWGNNAHGQLGIGSAMGWHWPVMVDLGPGAGIKGAQLCAGPEAAETLKFTE